MWWAFTPFLKPLAAIMMVFGEVYAPTFVSYKYQLMRFSEAWRRVQEDLPKQALIGPITPILPVRQQAIILFAHGIKPTACLS